MQILIISPTQNGIGGIAQHVKGLSNFLKKNNHEVDIISSENTLTIPIKGLKNPSFMVSSFLKTKFGKKYDIVHAHNIPSALAMKSASGKKVLTIHGVFSKQVSELHGKATGRISSSFEKDALGWADAITVISKEAQEHYSQFGYNVTQVPNAIDMELLSKEKDRQYKKQIIFAGRLSKEKGIDTLIQIAKKIPNDIHLVILGSGPEEEKIRELAKSKKNIHYLGYAPKEKTISLIRGSDILVQPSLIEGISSTILEAMACKTPVIATNVGGNNELIEDRKTGFLVAPNNPDEILKKISHLFDNESERRSIAEESFTFVQNYDWNQVGKLYLNIYESLLDQSK